MPMAEAPQKNSADVRIFPPAAPLVTVLLGVAIDILVPIKLEFLLPAPTRYWIGGIVIVGAFVGLGFWSVFLMRTGGQSENPWKPTSHIERRGPFRITRNPMYLQMVLICIGFAVLLANVWILVLTPFCAWTLQQLAIKPEEAYLERKFGDDYLAYKRSVRRWI